MIVPLSRPGLILLLTAMMLFSPARAADNNTLPIPEAWANSAHSDASSASFTHWNDEGEIPANCATCHASTGYQDYLGADGSEVGKVDKPHPTGSVVDCKACHNDATKTLTSVTFPSGAIIDNVESSVQCLVCHQGRESTVSVNRKLNGLDNDSVSAELSFINIHYRAAAATAFGSEVQGGYEYPGHQYNGRFTHPPPFNTCTGCHDAHSLSLAVDTCAQCHKTSNPVAIRFDKIDYDGDGDTEESIVTEVHTLHRALRESIKLYSAEVGGKTVVYSPEQYPYFFNDSNNNGGADDDELTYPNRYQSWTPRLLKAAYNYQFVAKDPGGYVHNPKYVLQLLYDSIEDLGKVVGVEVGEIKRPG